MHHHMEAEQIGLEQERLNLIERIAEKKGLEQTPPVKTALTKLEHRLAEIETILGFDYGKKAA